VLDEIKSAYESLSLTGLALHDQKTEAIVNSQMAAMKATLLVAKRLDRVIELLEASAQERSKEAALHDGQRPSRPSQRGAGSSPSARRYRC
jgi:hypothetical protein